ncbi:MAG: delta 1-pyrroline-5-carboxylate reductase [Chaenotheca gracillima]|nr:MAG: delta 1-pyrroline-5-carboxylate reductase [Chaenotheca gracillima]
MADPFDVRLRFTTQLQHLNASVASSQKAAHFALKYRDMDEDLHSCILEQLERNSMNNRANIMYFIEHLCDMALRDNHHEFVRMVQRDILRVVDAVTPEDGSGAANIKVLRRVLTALHQKSILPAESLAEIEECLKDRDTLPSHAAVLSPLAATNSGIEQSSTVSKTSLETTPRGGSIVAKPNGVLRPDKRSIEQRIEEDRERHKRLRENIWAVPADGAEGEGEFDKLWDEASDVGEDDYLAAEEEKMERMAVVAAD